MDRLIYTAMTGAAQSLEQQSTVANNLANASTTGFKAQLSAFRQVPMNFEGNANGDPSSRTFVLASTPTADYTPGPIQQTGNPLDVAIQGPGWLSVQAADGTEAYTRAGNLHVDANGQIVTASNLPVIGTGGPISVPPGAEITIGKDGTVSAIGPGDRATAIAAVDQLKLVNPDPASLSRGDDGLFHTADGNPADADPAVTVAPASLEGSNVNAVSAMVDMITNARQFQMQTKMLDSANQMDQSANKLLDFS
jgi:flagellar basal-body rod protein FlgF